MTNNEFTILANLISRTSSVKCIPHEDFHEDRWQADPVNKIIRYPFQYYYGNREIGFLIHEVGHLIFTTGSINLEEEGNKISKWMKKHGKKAEQIWFLINSLEDLRIEKKMTDLYRGAATYLKKGTIWTNESNKKYSEYLKKTDTASYKEQCGAKWFSYGKYFLWLYAINKKVAEESLKRWDSPKIVKETVDKTASIIKKSFTCEDTQAICDLINKELLVHYLPLCDNKTPIDEIREILSEAVGIIVEIDKEIKQKREENNKNKAMALAGGESSEEEKESPESSVNLSQRILPDIEKKANKYIEDYCEEDRNEDDSGGRGDILVRSSGETNSKEKDRETIGPQLMARIDEATRINASKIRKAISIIKDMETVRYEGNYQSGKLQNRKLYKLKTGQNNIFTRKTEPQKDNTDVAFALLIDKSGSMRGENCKSAFISTAIMAKALKSVGKSFGVFGFNDSFYTYKDFNDNDFSLSKIKGILTAIGGNNDGYAVRKAMEQLNNQPQKKKILIVISDGEACEPEALEEELKKAEKTATVYGIGIELEAIKDYFKNAVVIDNVSMLGGELLKIFKAVVGKRRR